MKQMLKSLMSVAVAALALTSCSNDATEDQILKDAPKTLEVNAAIDRTRTSMAADHVDLQWSEGDEIYLYIGETAAKADVIKHTIGGDPIKAVYNEGDNVYANYSLNNSYSEGVQKAEINIVAAQKQTEANVFAGENLPMVAKGTIAGGKVDLTFKPVGCVLVFNVYGPVVDEKIKSVKFETSVGCCGFTMCNLTAETLGYKAYDKYTSATVTLGTPAAIGAAKPGDTKIGENQVYLVVAPVNYADAKITVTAESGQTYTFVTANGIDCSASTARVVNLNLAKAPEMQPAIEVPAVAQQPSTAGDFQIDGISFKNIAAEEIPNTEVGVYSDAELTQPFGENAWLTISNTANLAAGQLTCQIAANETAENRTAYIGIKCAGVQAAIAVTQVAQGASTDKYYVKVTEALGDWTGEYLIVYEAGALALNGALKAIDAVGNTISVDITEQGILSNDTTNAASVKIAKIEGSTDGYTLQACSGSYLYSTSDSNHLKTGMDLNEAAQNPNAISIENGAAKIENHGAILRFNKTSNQMRFRFYKSSSYTNQQPVQLYKLQ